MRFKVAKVQRDKVFVVEVNSSASVYCENILFGFSLKRDNKK